jgi:hypothetical protein
MTFILELGTSTLALPSALQDLPRQSIIFPETTLTQLKQAKILLALIENTPNYITILNSTPSYLYLAAAMRWPNAIFLAEEGNAWLDLSSQKYWPQHIPQVVAPTAYSEVVSPQTEVVNSVTKEQVIVSSEYSQSDNSLLFDIFKFSAWNAVEFQAKIDHLLHEASTRHLHSPLLLAEAQKCRRLGIHSNKLWQDIEKRLQQGGESPEFTLWLNSQLNNSHKRVFKDINIRLDKWRKRQHELKEKRSLHRNLPIACLIEPLHLQHKSHPNSLRHLPTQLHWQVLIDETGSDFSHNPELGIRDTKLGRVVALVLPASHQLPQLTKGFHSVTETSQSIDEAVNNLLHAPVGILGITVKDTIAGELSNWFSNIYALVRLVMRLLPINNQQPCKVEFLIEQRGEFDGKVSLNAIQQLLQSELLSLDSQRFANVSTLLRFTNKDEHPANGYVDAIAYTWATSNQQSRLRLRHAALLQHCLLEPSHQVIERAYAAIENHHNLAANDWYTLTSAVGQESSTSLLPNLLAQLGEYAQKHPELWMRYLNHVRQHLLQKDYALPDLAATLSWLNQWQPADKKLPPRLKLQWQAARLACANHFGATDLAQIEDCLQLGQQLIDEVAPEVCEAHLRIAVAATNAFEFDTASHILNAWQNQEAAVCGLVNKAKVLSSLGQHRAFVGDYAQALCLFDESLALFARLTDTQESRKESEQTNIYRLTVLMDDTNTTASMMRQHLEHYFDKPLDKIAEQLSTQGNPTRYVHLLFLRALVFFAELRTHAQNYFARSESWQTGLGHPWPLINTYRALLITSQQPQLAQDYMTAAINDCRDNDYGGVMHWMGEVLAITAEKLAITAPLVDTHRQQSLQQSLTHAPWASLEHLQQLSTHSSQRDILSAFSVCLPFNFH